MTSVPRWTTRRIQSRTKLLCRSAPENTANALSRGRVLRFRRGEGFARGRSRRTGGAAQFPGQGRTGAGCGREPDSSHRGQDFGWLVFATRANSPSVILIRIPASARSLLLGHAISKLVREYASRLTGAFVVLRSGTARIKSGPPSLGMRENGLGSGSGLERPFVALYAAAENPFASRSAARESRSAAVSSTNGGLTVAQSGSEK